MCCKKLDKNKEVLTYVSVILSVFFTLIAGMCIIYYLHFILFVFIFSIFFIISLFLYLLFIYSVSNSLTLTVFHIYMQ